MLNTGLDNQPSLVKPCCYIHNKVNAVLTVWCRYNQVSGASKQRSSGPYTSRQTTVTETSCQSSAQQRMGKTWQYPYFKTIDIRLF